MAKDTSKLLAFINMARDYEAEMILDELTLYLKELLLGGNGKFSPMIIERFFRVIAESKALLALGSDGEFVLSLALFKMMESLEIKDIDTMIRGLENELKGVEVSEIMVSTPVADVSAPTEVITITEDEITATLSSEKVKPNTENTEVQEANDKTEKKSEPITTDDTSTNSVTENDKVVEPIKTKPAHIEEVSTPTPQINPHQKTFDTLLEKIFDRDFDLGGCFENNIHFISFEDNKLTWESEADGDDKKTLVTHWGVINMFVKECFGFETKIVNIPKKKTLTSSNEEPVGSVHRPEQEPPSVTHNDANTTSMIEETQMKSSCIAPEAGNTEAAKEKDPSTLLQEPMVKEAIALFDPKKVRIKRNS